MHKAKRQKKSSLKGENAVERFLVQKLFQRWKVVTFGKHTLSDMSKYYERKLLMRCLRNWGDLHISSRKQWKLEIRADYHDRYRLWAKTFKAWKQYIRYVKIKKMKEIEAHKHAEKALLHRVFDAFRDNVSLERKKVLMKRKADHYHSRLLQRSYWKWWLVCFNNKALSKNMQYVALHHWAKRTKSKAFQVWKSAFLDAFEIKQKMEYCKAYHNRKLAVLTLDKWKEFVRKEGVKKRKIGHLLEIRHQNAKRLAFQMWCKSYACLQIVERTEEKVKHMGESCIKRRYLYLWMRYRQCRKLFIEKINGAESTYTLNLKKKVIHSLQMYSQLRIQISQQKNQAVRFHTQKVLSYHFSKWMIGCENQEDIKLHPLSQIALKYYRTKYYSRVMFCWTQFLKEEKLKKRKYELAVLHHDKNILPRYFCLWKDYIAVQNHVQTMNEAAKKFRSDILHTKYFYGWIKSYQQKENNIEMLSQGVKHYEFMVLKRYHKCWIQATKMKLQRNSMEKHSDNHYAKNITSCSFLVWRKKYQDAVECKEHGEKAITHRNRKLLHNCFQNIKKYHAVCRKRSFKENQAVKHANTTISRKMIIAWKLYTTLNIQRNATAEEMRTEKLLILQRWAFHRWKMFVRDERWQKRKTDEVEQRFKQRLQKKVFDALRAYSTQRIDKRLQDDERTVRAQIKLEKGKMFRIFHVWRVRTTEMKHSKRTQAIAKNHLRKITTRKCLQCLKEQAILSKRKKIMMADSMIFRVRHIMKIQFDVWQKKHSNALEERKKSNLSLVWWSYQLQVKTFRALKIYTNHSKQKKRDYQNALNFRRELLIEIGVVNWIQYANEAIERRRNVAYKEQMKQCMEMQARVHKYALHWLRRTQRKKQQQVQHNNQQANEISTTQINDPLIPQRHCTVNNYESKLVSASKRFKSFEVTFPKRKSRPSPRRPDYLRDSYDISALMLTQQNESDIVPRSASWICPPHSHHTLQLSCDSAKMLELTSEESDIMTMKATLLPPSSFQ